MLHNTRGELDLPDCKGQKIQEGDILNYRNPKNVEWSGDMHKVIWSEERNCYCLLREDSVVMRISGHGRWKPERWIIHSKAE